MANNVKLLLVEDNPMVLGMLQQALSPLATVTSAPDGADALMKAVDDPPDLVVSDYRMPGMDGRQLVEKLKSRPATANFSAVLMASKSDIAERLSQQDAADDYLEKPFFLKDATRRIKRMIDRIALEKMAKTAPSDGVVRGNLAQMNVIDLMQSLEMGRKSCKLSLTYEGDRCEVFFVEGQVKHATYGDLVGDPAVFKVLRWTGGNFQLDFEGKTDKETTQLNTQGLLMEGLRLLDESQRDGGESEDTANAASSATSSAVESNSSTSSFSDPIASHPPGPPGAAPTPAAPSSASSFSDPFAAHPPGPPAAAPTPATSTPVTTSTPAPPRKKEEEEDVLLDN
jgi:CheY-like chemotaxis protein